MKSKRPSTTGVTKRGSRGAMLDAAAEILRDDRPERPGTATKKSYDSSHLAAAVARTSKYLDGKDPFQYERTLSILLTLSPPLTPTLALSTPHPLNTDTPSQQPLFLS